MHPSNQVNSFDNDANRYGYHKIQRSPSSESTIASQDEGLNLNSVPKIDFSREYLAFLRIPKSAGTTVTASICDFLERKGCALLRDSKIEQFRRNRLDEKIYAVERKFKDATLRASGKHPLAPHL